MVPQGARRDREVRARSVAPTAPPGPAVPLSEARPGGGSEVPWPSAQRAAQRRRPRPAADPDVAIDRAGNRGGLVAAAADRGAEVRVVRVRRVAAARRREAE